MKGYNQFLLMLVHPLTFIIALFVPFPLEAFPVPFPLEAFPVPFPLEAFPVPFPLEAFPSIPYLGIEAT